MKNTFEKATEASRNGYIADQNSIDWIIGKLLDIPLIDFRCVSSEILMKLLADFMRDSGMNEFRSHQVTFGEMLGMTELMTMSPIWLTLFICVQDFGLLCSDTQEICFGSTIARVPLYTCSCRFL